MPAQPVDQRGAIVARRPTVFGFQVLEDAEPVEPLVVFMTKADLAIENLALRQQVIVLQRRVKRPVLLRRDRVFWLWLARCWDGWRDTLIGCWRRARFSSMRSGLGR